jgi:hypothetical protein
MDGQLLNEFQNVDLSALWWRTFLDKQGIGRLLIWDRQDERPRDEVEVPAEI